MIVLNLTQYTKGCCYDKSASDPKQMCYYGEKSYRDLYFLGYGHGIKEIIFSIVNSVVDCMFTISDYKLALKEFGMV